MRRVTFSLCLATALAGYAAGQWQLADSRSIAQDAAAPPPAAAAPAVEQPAESDLERKYVEKSRQLFRTLTPEQQQQAVGAMDQQLRQAEALAAIKKVEKELREIAEKYPGTAGANLAIEAERVLRQRTTAPMPVYNSNVPFSPGQVIPQGTPATTFDTPFYVPDGFKPTPIPDDAYYPASPTRDNIRPGTATEKKAKSAS